MNLSINVGIHLHMVIRVRERQYLSNSWGIPEDGNQVNLEMNFGDCYWVNSEIHLEAIIVQT